MWPTFGRSLRYREPGNPCLWKTTSTEAVAFISIGLAVHTGWQWNHSSLICIVRFSLKRVFFSDCWIVTCGGGSVGRLTRLSWTIMEWEASVCSSYELDSFKEFRTQSKGKGTVLLGTPSTELIWTFKLITMLSGFSTPNLESRLTFAIEASNAYKKKSESAGHSELFTLFHWRSSRFPAFKHSCMTKT